MSSVAAPPDRTRPERAARAPAARRRPRPGARSSASALAVALAAVGLRAGGGLALGPTTKVEMALDVVGGAARRAGGARASAPGRWWGAAALAALRRAGRADRRCRSPGPIQPSDAWLEANRTFAYLAVFARGVVLARLGGAWWSACVGGDRRGDGRRSASGRSSRKVFPGALAPDEIYARLREPYGYWNAVGLTAALGVPAALWLGARRSGHAALNALAYPVHGAAAAHRAARLLARLAAGGSSSGCAFWFAVVPLRLRGVAVLAAGALGALAVAAGSSRRTR